MLVKIYGDFTMSKSSRLLRECVCFKSFVRMEGVCVCVIWNFLKYIYVANHHNCSCHFYMLYIVERGQLLMLLQLVPNPNLLYFANNFFRAHVKIQYKAYAWDNFDKLSMKNSFIKICTMTIQMYPHLKGSMNLSYT